MVGALSRQIFACAAYDFYNKLPSPAIVAAIGPVYITYSEVHSATAASDAIYFVLIKRIRNILEFATAFLK